MAELVDALVSGTSVRKYVKVRVLSWALMRLRRKSKAESGKSISPFKKPLDFRLCTLNYFAQVAELVDALG